MKSGSKNERYWNPTRICPQHQQARLIKRELRPFLSSPGDSSVIFNPSLPLFPR
jgi:hypothetical protein